MVPRHPSQLYEFGLEGILLLIIVDVRRRARSVGAVSGLFPIGYGNVPPSRARARARRVLGFLAGGFTMGQLLSMPMIAVGVVMMVGPTAAPPARRSRR